MPLILLGLLLLLGILGYSLMSYMNNVQSDNRPVRERYPHAFPVYPPKEGADGQKSEEEPPVDAESYYDEDSVRGDIDYMIRNIKEDLIEKAKSINIDLESIAEKFSGSNTFDEEDNTVEFPKDNIENEKKKRGINSD